MDFLDYKDERETSEYAGMYPKFRRRAPADELLPYQSRVDGNGKDFDKWRGRVRGGISKGGMHPPLFVG